MQENQALLLKCISEDIGFSEGKPVAAFLIYKCLLHWRSFEVERTGIFDHIIQTIGVAIEVLTDIGLFELFKSQLPNFCDLWFNLRIGCLVSKDEPDLLNK